ncbi:MAG: tetratricopeptide repeat protein [Spirochaetes bacterium]|nr:tetratricopeptide repeat protein [Spirochaetota bacterium]
MLILKKIFNLTIMTVITVSGLFSFSSCKDQNKNNEEAYNFYLKGKEAYQNQDLDHAARLFSEAADKNSNLLNAKVMLAKIYYHKTDFSNALSVLNEILKNDEDHINSLYWKSRILIVDSGNNAETAKKNESEAIKSLNRVLELDSYHIPARLLLALIYEKNKLYKEAIFEYKSALNEQEVLVNARANLSILYNRLGLKEKSKKEMEIAIRIADSAKIENRNLLTLKEEIK